MTTPEVWTIGRILTWSVDFLRDKGQTDSPRLDAELLLAHTIGMSRIQLYTNFDKPLTAHERDPYRGYLLRRSKGEPIAYIIGSKEFMGLPFLVSPAVLIPRPDTEVLVETARDALKDVESPLILDVGTGSGCIAVALGHLLKASTVAAWDISDEALQIARENGVRHQVEIRLSSLDGLKSESWATLEPESLDLIVSNPPYIAPFDSEVGVGVRAFEPHSALFAPPDGLVFYRALAQYGKRVLKTNGVLAVEIGYTQREQVVEIFRSNGWHDIKSYQDYNKQDRVITGRNP